MSCLKFLISLASEIRITRGNWTLPTIKCKKHLYCINWIISGDPKWSALTVVIIGITDEEKEALIAEMEKLNPKKDKKD